MGGKGGEQVSVWAEAPGRGTIILSRQRAVNFPSELLEYVLSGGRGIMMGDRHQRREWRSDLASCWRAEAGRGVRNW